MVSVRTLRAGWGRLRTPVRASVIFTLTAVAARGIAFLSTLICLLIAYPLALVMSRMTPRGQRMMNILVMLPMWMNFLKRICSLEVLLMPEGVINHLFGLESNPIYYTWVAVIIGIVYNYLPFMVLPIYTVLSKISKPVLEAGKDLGDDLLAKLRHKLVPRRASVTTRRDQNRDVRIGIALADLAQHLGHDDLARNGTRVVARNDDDLLLSARKHRKRLASDGGCHRRSDKGTFVRLGNVGFDRRRQNADKLVTELVFHIFFAVRENHFFHITDLSPFSFF